MSGVAGAVVVGVVAGGLHALSLRWDSGWVLGWIALVPLLRVAATGVRRETIAATIAYAVTLGQADVVPWLLPAAERYFGLDRAMATLVASGGIAALSAMYGVLLAAALVLRRQVRPALGVVWCAAVWCVWESLRTVVPPSLPSCMIGMSQARVPAFLQMASLTGIFGISALVTAVNAALAEISLRRFAAGRPAVLAGLAALVLGLAFWGERRIPSPEPSGESRPSVLLVDGAATRAEESTLERYIAATDSWRGAAPDLVVWPESALDVDLERTPNAWKRLRGFVDAMNVPLATGGVGGALRADGTIDRFNSVHFVRPGHGMESYHKRLLVPFAESWPAALGPAPARLSPVVPGRDVALFGDDGGDDDRRRFGPLICFEITDSATARHLSASGARMLVSFNNDVWFPAGGAPHWEWARVRAVESGLPVVRVTNHGTSAVIDPFGRVTASMESAGTPAALAAAVPERTTTAYVRTGEVVLPACIVIVLAGIVPRRRRDG